MRNPFTPEFLKWTLPSLNLVICIIDQSGFSKISIAEWHSVDPDEMATYEPTHLYLHCLHRYFIGMQ